MATSFLGLRLLRLRGGRMIDEQAERIKERMAEDLEYAIETGDIALFEDIFEDRDPFEFL